MDPHGASLSPYPRLHFLKGESGVPPTAPSDMAFSQSHKCLRPTPPTPPDHWSAPAPPPVAPEPSASATSHPKLPVLRPRRFGAAPTQVQHIRNPPRTGTKSVPERRAVSSYSLETAPGKPCADSHSARRCDESAVLRSAACGRSSPSATPITLNTATVIRQQGLLVRVP